MLFPGYWLSAILFHFFPCSSAGANPFLHLEKSAVLQETRTFNDNVINSRKCATILTKVLCLLNQVRQLVPLPSRHVCVQTHTAPLQGTTMNSTEATETFFATTKLFQSKDVSLRRLVYLAIKEMATIADDVIIVTSRYMYIVYCVHACMSRGQ